jgi:hypothetical protein
VAAALDDPPPPALLVLLPLLLLAQPATASEPSAATAMIRRPFIGYASISVISHYVGVDIARIGRWPAIRRHLGRRRVLRLGAAFEKLKTPSPPAEFVTLIKPLPFTPRQGD